MANIRDTVKRLILTTLPQEILQTIKRYHYCRTLKSVPTDDEPDLKVLDYLIKPDDSVVDIGANIGLYTKRMSELVGIDGHVFGIEPIPLTFDILSFNIRKLGLTNVELIDCAISDTNGTVTFEVPLYQSGGENFYRAKVVEKRNDNSLRQVKTESRTIDSLFHESRYKICFIKCDVEGHELECIKGATMIIKEAMPAWLIEISGDPDEAHSKASEVFNILAEAGYTAYWFDGKRLLQRRRYDNSINYFFFAPKHVSSLKQEGLLITDG